MSMQIINKQNADYKKTNTGVAIGGVVVGYLVAGLTNLPRTIMSSSLSDKLTKLSDELSLQDTNALKMAAEKGLKDSGLNAKGIEFFYASYDNVDEAVKVVTKESNKGLARFLPKKIKNFLGERIASQIVEGSNAYYAPLSKKIIAPDGKLGLALFHEMGHAMNDNFSKVGKFLQSSRSLSILVLPIMLISLFKNKKAEGEKSEGGLDKATTFIKENAGKLSFVAMLPIMLEEGMATIKGNKLAKQLLDSTLATKVAKANAIAFSTYALTALCTSLGAFFGAKARDAIVHKKDN